MKKMLIPIAACVSCLGIPFASIGQTYPAKPIRIIVPYAAGGPTDILARTVAQRLIEVWGQPVVVENRSGAAGMAGTAVVAKAPADGYTLCTAGITFVTASVFD